MSNPATDLRNQIGTLRKAVEDCMGEPKAKAVHLLRTSARRVQAQLQLVSLLPEFPKMTKQTKRFLRAVRPVRRAAGEVRDLDVHMEHLAELAESEDTIELAARLKRRRERRAAKLQRVLYKRQGKLLSAIDELEGELLPVHHFHMDADGAGRVARNWYAETTTFLDPKDPMQLHDLRKAAKLARYIAESPSRTKRSRTAQHFNRIQKATGEWHDWLTLEQIARKYLSRRSPFLEKLRAERDSAHKTALTRVLNT